MQVRNRGWRWGTFAALVMLASVLVAACGSSTSSNPNTLLKQTFSGSHKIESGNLSFRLTITPSGSSTLRGPITLDFGGPFQSRGKGKLPQSNFNLSVNALGKAASLGLLSTGTSGYVSLQGQAYQLPQATFQRLESNFAQIASPSGSGSNKGALSQFGIQPLNWLSNPTIVGSENLGGTTTTHIRAGVNVPALVNGISQFLQKASKLGVSGTTKFPSGLSTSTKSKIAGEIQSPSFDVWTGNDDKTMRKLQLGLRLPVTGQTSTSLGGVTSATVGLIIQYTDLNQPQTISAPSSVQPYTQFQAKIQALVQALSGGGLAGGAGTTGAGTAGAGTTGAGTTGAGTTGAVPPATSSGGATGSTTPGSSTSVTAYSQCIQAAGSDVTKLQQCASLLNTK